MKKWMLCLLCTLVLSLAGASLASATPISPAPSPADQQFLASLAAPAPAPADVPQQQWMAKPPPPPDCGPDFCSDAQRAACQALHPTCITSLACSYVLCTANCTYDPRSCNW